MTGTSGHGQAQRDRARDLVRAMQAAQRAIEEALAPGQDPETAWRLIDQARLGMSDVSTRYGGLLADWRTKGDRRAATADQVLTAIAATIAQLEGLK